MNSEIDEVIAAFYAAFDNRGSRPVHTDRLIELFAPEARVVRLSDGVIHSWSVNDFILPREAMLSDGTLTNFHEWETTSRTTVLADIASRESHYEKSGTMNGQPYAGVGRKFIQLCRLDGRWRITAVLWQDL